VSLLVLDSGALIALERNDRILWAALKDSAMQSDDVLVPSTALAQVWRAASSQALLARALRQCVIAPFDPVARRVGELCGRARTEDICDAHVAVVAATHGGVLYTSDVGDLRPLIVACRARTPVIISC
jgi:hypothetical protein